MSIRNAIPAVLLGIVAGLGCRPSDILDVPPPSGEFTSKAIQGPTATLQAFYGARSQLAAVIGQTDGLVESSGLLSDEMAARNLGGLFQGHGSIDGRYTSSTETLGAEYAGDNNLQELAGARAALVLALQGLQQYAATTTPAAIGEAYALLGYTEMLMAEDYCAGVPLSEALPNGGWSFGAPLSQDSLFAVAESHFYAALAHAADSATVQSLASIGLARTLLDRDSVAAAAQAVANVSTDFVYNTQLPGISQNISAEPDNMYDNALFFGGAGWGLSDREGENGLNFVSAADPRLLTDSETIKTQDIYEGYADSNVYYPLKFGEPSTGLIPLATGVEARLIAAEAAEATNDPSWLTDLNTLRTNGCRHAEVSDTSCTYGTGQVPSQPSGLQPLTDPGTDSARVSLLFRERAFWLFGTGERLGDMRRQVRQYGQYWRSSAAVFPTGAYATGVLANVPGLPSSYGTDVAFTLPAAATGITTTNPYYRGCLTSTTVA